eukprot:CFRG2836T1
MVGRLRIDDCSDDTPLLRSRITHLERATQSLESRLIKMADLTRQRFELDRVQIRIAEEIADEIVEFSNRELDEEDQDIQDALDKFATALKTLEQQREMMSQQVNTALRLSFEKFVRTDLALVKESQRSYESAQSQISACCDRFAACKKGDHLGMIEAAKYMYESKCKFHQQSCQYAMAQMTAHNKKKILYLEKMLDALTSQMAFFQLGNKVLQPLEPLMNKCFEQLKVMKKSFADNQAVDDEEFETSIRKRADEFQEEYVTFQTNDLLNTSPATVRPRPTTDFTKSGYLFVGEKKPFGYLWTREYFYVIDGILMRQANHTVPPAFSANLMVCTVKKMTDIDRNYCFTVISPQKTLILQGESRASIESWIQIFINAIAFSLNNQNRRLGPGSPTSALTTLDPSTIDSDGRDRTVDMLPILSGIMHNNLCCADCGEEGADWASINIGAVICIQCSGIHRSLGVTISQVRSLTLDTWNPSMLNVLTHTNNKLVNSKYESNLAKSTEPKPTSESSRDCKESWITQKYVDLMFMNKEDKLQVLENRNAIMERMAAERDAFRKQRLKSENDGGLQGNLQDIE